MVGIQIEKQKPKLQVVTHTLYKTKQVFLLVILGFAAFGVGAVEFMSVKYYTHSIIPWINGGTLAGCGLVAMLFGLWRSAVNDRNQLQARVREFMTVVIKEGADEPMLEHVAKNAKASLASDDLEDVLKRTQSAKDSFDVVGEFLKDVTNGKYELRKINQYANSIRRG